MSKKVISIFLTAILILSMFMVSVSADSPDDGSGTNEGGNTEFSTDDTGGGSGDTGQGNGGSGNGNGQGQVNDPEDDPEDDPLIDQGPSDGGDGNGDQGNGNDSGNNDNEGFGDGDETDPSNNDGNENGGNETPITDDGEWIPSVEQPADYVQYERAVICRVGSSTSDDDIQLFGTLETVDEMSDEDWDRVRAEKLQVWNGFKYKKAAQVIEVTSGITDEESGDIVIKYGSDPHKIQAEAPNGIGSMTIADESIATVDQETGEITAQGIGSTRLTITADGTKYYKNAEKEITVVVEKGTQTITTDKDDYSVYIGAGSFALGGATNGGSELIYESSDPDKVSVDEEGVVTINDLTGDTPAVITITADGNDLYDAAEAKTVNVTVVKPRTPALTVKAIGGRKIQLSWTKVVGNVTYQVYCPQMKSSLRYKTTTSTSVKNTKLKKKKTYKYRVRAIVTVNGKKYYSSWSAYKSAKVK